MYFLLVDDILDLEAMKRSWEAEFPGAIVHTARSTEEAGERIAFAERRRFVYTVVILDFKLPRTAQDHEAVVDLITRDRINSSVATRRAAVFHITGYADDPEIRAWVEKERRRNPLLAEPFPIDKRDPAWRKNLNEAIRRVVYEIRVEQRLKLLCLGNSGGMPLAAAGRVQGPISISVTQEISGLAEDIEEHWNYLSEGLRNEVRQVFPLVESHDAGKDSARIQLPSERRKPESAVGEGPPPDTADFVNRGAMHDTPRRSGGNAGG